MTPEHESPAPVGAENFTPPQLENKPPGKDRNDIFTEWLQQRILTHMDESHAKQNSPTAEAAVKRAYIASGEFRKKLKHWEPWRLDNHSLDKGTNLYLQAAKGYTTEPFRAWVKNEANNFAVSEDKYLAAIIEIIRKIEWETIKLMAVEGCAKTYTLPHLIIGPVPHTDPATFHSALESAKGGDTSTLFSRDAAVQRLSYDAQKLVMLSELEQAYGHFARSGRVALDGTVVEGAHWDNIIALDEVMVKNSFMHGTDNTLVLNAQLIVVVVEEEIHHQGYKQKELDAMKQSYESHLQERDEQNTKMWIIAGQKAEQDVGIKKMRDKILQNLPSDASLLEHFYQRIRS